jgi:hypothetical protein
LKKIYLVLIISAALIAGLAAGTFGLSRFVDEDVSLPLLKITGDVRNVKKITGLNSIKDMQAGEGSIKNNRVAYLKQVIESAEPFSKYNSVIITSHDGTAVRLDYDDVKMSRLSFDPQDGWNVMDPDHPAGISIKMIEEIILVSQNTDSCYEYGMDIISTDKNILRITPGQAYGKTSEYLKREGDVYTGGNTGERQASMYSVEKILKIEDLLGYEVFGSIVVMGRDGNILYADHSGYIELEDNHFNYVNSRAEGKIVGDTAGIIIDAPSGSIMDAYHDLKYHIHRGEKVMLIILDGLGYHQYIYAVDNGYIDFMAEASSVKPAVSVFRPVTNAGLAAMFTGKPPAYSGIDDHDKRESLIPTVFASVIEDNTKTLYVEGDIQIIKTEIEPELNTDRDRDGDRDDDILEYSISNMDKGFELMVVHFHSIDDMGHNFGDITGETMDEIKRLDMYVKELVSMWEGYVVVTADHGMHSTEDGGSHGEFRYEDMIVPYIVFCPGDKDYLKE